MKLKRLELTNFRVFEQATFDFQPGMNLLVGINGTGKSSVLDALRILLSHTRPRFTAFRGRGSSFGIDDITIGRDGLMAHLHFELGESSFSQLMRQQREEDIPVKEREGQVRGQTYDTGERNSFIVHKGGLPKGSRTAVEQSLTVYFSPHRSLLSMGAPSKQASAGGQAAAFAYALSPRGLRLREFAEWWLAQETLLRDEADSITTHRLETLADVVERFLEGYTHLRAVGDLATPFTWDSSEWDSGERYDGSQLPTLRLDKGDITLDVRQLSDGERGLLALVFDLARRLSLANPKLEDPLREGKGIVLIDELDLHLHPRWQRTVVEKLTKTFPNCQFIATTHSPFIIQSLRPGQLINLESKNSSEEYADKSVEDIAEFIMGTPMPQKSQRYQDMMKTAEQYFRLLRSTHTASSEEKEKLKRHLDELSIPFSDDPAYMALLKVEHETMLGEDDS